MAKIRKGDRVIVLSGKDKGKEGNVVEVHPKTDRAIVELIRQRVAEESGEGADLSLAVEQQHRAEARADED